MAKPLGQPHCGSFKRGDSLGHSRIDTDQIIDSLRGGQAGHGRQPLAQIKVGPQQVRQTLFGPQDLREGLLQNLKGERLRPISHRNGVARNLVGKIEQSGDLLLPIARGGQMGRNAAAKQIGRVGLAIEPNRSLSEALSGRVGEAALLVIGSDTFKGTLGKALKRPHDLMDRQAPALRFRDRYFLDGALQVHL